jgi:hypothetical protein
MKKNKPGRRSAQQSNKYVVAVIGELPQVTAAGHSRKSQAEIEGGKPVGDRSLQ